MPSYTFKNNDTDEIWDEIMSWDERCSFLDDNPHIKQIIIKAPQLVRSQYVGGIKNDDGWKENLSRIAEAHPGSELARTHGSKDAKTVKTQTAVDKWRKSQGKI